MKEAVIGASPMADACFIAVSGDIANTGDPAEYAVGRSFFSDLRSAIAAAGVRQVELVVIPGNHDCNFRQESETRKFILTNLTQYLDGPVDFSGSNFEAIMSVQNDFFEFEAALRNGQLLPPPERIYFTRAYSVGKTQVLFHCFNTSWLSRKNELQSELYIPTESLTGGTPQQTFLSVAMFHHPYNWLSAENYRALKRFVDTHADVVLTGHEHEAGFSRRQEFTTQTTHLEAPALRAPHSSKSEFQLLRINVDTSEQSLHRFEWTGEYFQESTSQQLRFVRNSARPENPFVISQSFRKYLSAVGTGFRHPRRIPC
jgi:hypothetical protein